MERKRGARRPCGPLGHGGLDLPVRLGAEKGAQYSGLTWAVYVSSSLAYECRMRHVHTEKQKPLHPRPKNAALTVKQDREEKRHQNIRKAVRFPWIMAIPMAVDRKCFLQYMLASRVLRWRKVFGGGKEALLPSQRKIPGYSLHGGAASSITKQLRWSVAKLLALVTNQTIPCLPLFPSKILAPAHFFLLCFVFL